VGVWNICENVCAVLDQGKKAQGFDMNQTRSTVLSRIQGSLLGVMIGDGMGMPVETMSRAKIIEVFGPGGVRDFVDPVQTRIEDTRHMRPGDTTDDWQLTKVVLISIIRTGGWNQERAILAHVDALRSTTFGWGKGSVSAVQEIIDGLRDGRSPPTPKPKQGLGNGVIMKVAPLAHFHALMQHHGQTENLKLLVAYTKELGAITHSDPRAWISAFAIASLITRCVLHAGEARIEDRHIFALARNVGLIERCFVDNPSRRVLEELIGNVPYCTHGSSYLHERFGSGFTALETLPFTIGTFLRHQKDFESGVLEAVNAGGDTDTNASIVGALIGATVGIEGIPRKWREFRPEYKEALSLGEELCGLFVGERIEA